MTTCQMRFIVVNAFMRGKHEHNLNAIFQAYVLVPQISLKIETIAYLRYRQDDPLLTAQNFEIQWKAGRTSPEEIDREVTSLK